jgi:hypothetical protein
MGFSIPALGLIVLTEGEVFGSRRRSLRRPKYQRGAALTAFTDLAPGDIIVHEDHGLGRYLGLQTMKVGDRERFPAARVLGGQSALPPGRAAPSSSRNISAVTRAPPASIVSAARPGSA